MTGFTLLILLCFICKSMRYVVWHGECYAYRIDGYWWIFVLAAVIAVAIAFGSVLWQTLKAAKTNPAIELKKE